MDSSRKEYDVSGTLYRKRSTVGRIPRGRRHVPWVRVATQFNAKNPALGLGWGQEQNGGGEE